jgi:hypothetical protein
VTFTATVTTPGAVPAGTVVFYDGTTTIGAVKLGASGTAMLTISSLAAGTHSITAAYSGDVNFVPATSTALSQVVDDFTFGPESGGSTTAKGSPGGEAVFSLAMTPPSGQTFPAPITFAVIGLPVGATATFTPSSIAAGAAETNVKMTVQLAKTASASPAPALFGRGGMTLALGLLLFPFVARRRINASKGWIAIVLGSAVLLGVLAGCTAGKSTSGGGSSSGTGSGVGSPPTNYTVLVTATSGQLGHTITLTLSVD